MVQYNGATFLLHMYRPFAACAVSARTHARFQYTLMNFTNGGTHSTSPKESIGTQKSRQPMTKQRFESCWSICKQQDSFRLNYIHVLCVHAVPEGTQLMAAMFIIKHIGLYTVACAQYLPASVCI